MTIRFLKLSLASPESIRSWTERILPNGKKVGKILKGDLIDYKNGLPIRDGLSCERIFGPMVSFTCSCGRFKCIETRGIHIVHDTFRTPRQASPIITPQSKRWGETINSESLPILEQNNSFGTNPWPKDDNIVTHTGNNKPEGLSSNLSIWAEELGTVLPFPSLTPREFLISSGAQNMILKKIPYHVPFFFKDLSYLCDRFQYLCSMATKISMQPNNVREHYDTLFLPLRGQYQRLFLSSVAKNLLYKKGFRSADRITLKCYTDVPLGCATITGLAPKRDHFTQKPYKSSFFLPFNKLKLQNISKAGVFYFIMKDYTSGGISRNKGCSVTKKKRPTENFVDLSILSYSSRSEELLLRCINRIPAYRKLFSRLYGRVSVYPKYKFAIPQFKIHFKLGSISKIPPQGKGYLRNTGRYFRLLYHAKNLENVSNEITKYKQKKKNRFFFSPGLKFAFTKVPKTLLYVSYRQWPVRNILYVSYRQWPVRNIKETKNYRAPYLFTQKESKSLYKYLFQIYTRFQFDLKIRYNDFIYKNPLVFSHYKIKMWPKKIVSGQQSLKIRTAKKLSKELNLMASLEKIPVSQSNFNHLYQKKNNRLRMGAFDFNYVRHMYYSARNFSYFSLTLLNRYGADRPQIQYLQDKKNWNWVPLSFLSTKTLGQEVSKEYQDKKTNTYTFYNPFHGRNTIKGKWKQRSSSQLYATSYLNQNIGGKKVQKLESIIKKNQEPLTSMVSNSTLRSVEINRTKVQNVGLPRPSRVYKFKTFPPEEIRYCPICEVELLPNSIRRYRLGYIEFVSPVAHIWYTASSIPLLLNLSKTLIEGIAACHEALSSGFPPVYKWSYNGSEPTSWTFQMQPLKLPINLLSVSPSYLFKPCAADGKKREYSKMLKAPFPSKLSRESNLRQNPEYFQYYYYGTSPAIDYPFDSSSSLVNSLSTTFNMGQFYRLSFITSYNTPHLNYSVKGGVNTPQGILRSLRPSIVTSGKKKNSNLITSSSSYTEKIKRSPILFFFSGFQRWNTEKKKVLETNYGKKAYIEIFSPLRSRKKKAFAFFKGGFLYNNTWFKEESYKTIKAPGKDSATLEISSFYNQEFEKHKAKKQIDNSFGFHHPIYNKISKPNHSFSNSDGVVNFQNLYKKGQIKSIWPTTLTDIIRKQDTIRFACMEMQNNQENQDTESDKLRKLKLSEFTSLDSFIGNFIPGVKIDASNFFLQKLVSPRKEPISAVSDNDSNRDKLETTKYLQSKLRFGSEAAKCLTKFDKASPILDFFPNDKKSVDNPLNTHDNMWWDDDNIDPNYNRYLKNETYSSTTMDDYEKKREWLKLEGFYETKDQKQDGSNQDISSLSIPLVLPFLGKNPDNIEFKRSYYNYDERFSMDTLKFIMDFFNSPNFDLDSTYRFTSDKAIFQKKSNLGSTSFCDFLQQNCKTSQNSFFYKKNLCAADGKKTQDHIYKKNFKKKKSPRGYKTMESNPYHYSSLQAKRYEKKNRSLFLKNFCSTRTGLKPFHFGRRNVIPPLWENFLPSYEKANYHEQKFNSKQIWFYPNRQVPFPLQKKRKDLNFFPKIRYLNYQSYRSENRMPWPEIDNLLLQKFYSDIDRDQIIQAETPNLQFGVSQDPYRNDAGASVNTIDEKINLNQVKTNETLPLLNQVLSYTRDITTSYKKSMKFNERLQNLKAEFVNSETINEFAKSLFISRNKQRTSAGESIEDAFHAMFGFSQERNQTSAGETSQVLPSMLLPLRYSIYYLETSAYYFQLEQKTRLEKTFLKNLFYRNKMSQDNRSIDNYRILHKNKKHAKNSYRLRRNSHINKVSFLLPVMTNFVSICDSEKQPVIKWNQKNKFKQVINLFSAFWRYSDTSIGIPPEEASVYPFQRCTDYFKRGSPLMHKKNHALLSHKIWKWIKPIFPNKTETGICVRSQANSNSLIQIRAGQDLIFEKPEIWYQPYSAPISKFYRLSTSQCSSLIKHTPSLETKLFENTNYNLDIDNNKWNPEKNTRSPYSQSIMKNYHQYHSTNKNTTQLPKLNLKDRIMHIKNSIYKNQINKLGTMLPGISFKQAGGLTLIKKRKKFNMALIMPIKIWSKTYNVSSLCFFPNDNHKSVNFLNSLKGYSSQFMRFTNPKLVNYPLSKQSPSLYAISTSRIFSQYSSIQTLNIGIQEKKKKYPPGYPIVFSQTSQKSNLLKFFNTVSTSLGLRLYNKIGIKFSGKSPLSTNNKAAFHASQGEGTLFGFSLDIKQTSAFQPKIWEEKSLTRKVEMRPYNFKKGVRSAENSNVKHLSFQFRLNHKTHSDTNIKNIGKLTTQIEFLGSLKIYAKRNFLNFQTVKTDSSNRRFDQPISIKRLNHCHEEKKNRNSRRNKDNYSYENCLVAKEQTILTTRKKIFPIHETFSNWGIKKKKNTGFTRPLWIYKKKHLKDSSSMSMPSPIQYSQEDDKTIKRKRFLQNNTIHFTELRLRYHKTLICSIYAMGKNFIYQEGGVVSSFRSAKKKTLSNSMVSLSSKVSCFSYLKNKFSWFFGSRQDYEKNLHYTPTMNSSSSSNIQQNHAISDQSDIEFTKERSTYKPLFIGGFALFIALNRSPIASPILSRSGEESAPIKKVPLQNSTGVKLNSLKAERNRFAEQREGTRAKKNRSEVMGKKAKSNLSTIEQTHSTQYIPFFEGSHHTNYYACLAQITTWRSDHASWILFLKYIRANIYKGDFLLPAYFNKTNFQMMPRTGSIMLEQLLSELSFVPNQDETTFSFNTNDDTTKNNPFSRHASRDLPIDYHTSRQNSAKSYTQNQQSAELTKFFFPMHGKKKDLAWNKNQAKLDSYSPADPTPFKKMYGSPIPGYSDTSIGVSSTGAEFVNSLIAGPYHQKKKKLKNKTFAGKKLFTEQREGTRKKFVYTWNGNTNPNFNSSSIPSKKKKTEKKLCAADRKKISIRPGELTICPRTIVRQAWEKQLFITAIIPTHTWDLPSSMYAQVPFVPAFLYIPWGVGIGYQEAQPFFANNQGNTALLSSYLETQDPREIDGKSSFVVHHTKPKSFVGREGRRSFIVFQLGKRKDYFPATKTQVFFKNEFHNAPKYDFNALTKTKNPLHAYKIKQPIPHKRFSKMNNTNRLTPEYHKSNDHNWYRLNNFLEAWTNSGDRRTISRLIIPDNDRRIFKFIYSLIISFQKNTYLPVSPFSFNYAKKTYFRSNSLAFFDIGRYQGSNFMRAYRVLSNKQLGILPVLQQSYKTSHTKNYEFSGNHSVFSSENNQRSRTQKKQSFVYLYKKPFSFFANEKKPIFEKPVLQSPMGIVPSFQRLLTKTNTIAQPWKKEHLIRGKNQAQKSIFEARIPTHATFGFSQERNQTSASLLESLPPADRKPFSKRYGRVDFDTSIGISPEGAQFFAIKKFVKKKYTSLESICESQPSLGLNFYFANEKRKIYNILISPFEQERSCFNSTNRSTYSKKQDLNEIRDFQSYSSMKVNPNPCSINNAKFSSAKTYQKSDQKSDGTENNTPPGGTKKTAMTSDQSNIQKYEKKTMRYAISAAQEIYPFLANTYQDQIQGEKLFIKLKEIGHYINLIKKKDTLFKTIILKMNSTLQPLISNKSDISPCSHPAIIGWDLEFFNRPSKVHFTQEHTCFFPIPSIDGKKEKINVFKIGKDLQVFARFFALDRFKLDNAVVSEKTESKFGIMQKKLGGTVKTNEFLACWRFLDSVYGSHNQLSIFPASTKWKKYKTKESKDLIFNDVNFLNHNLRLFSQWEKRKNFMLKKMFKQRIRLTQDNSIINKIKNRVAEPCFFFNQQRINFFYLLSIIELSNSLIPEGCSFFTETKPQIERINSFLYHLLTYTLLKHPYLKKPCVLNRAKINSFYYQTKFELIAKKFDEKRIGFRLLTQDMIQKSPLSQNIPDDVLASTHPYVNSSKQNEWYSMEAGKSIKEAFHATFGFSLERNQTSAHPNVLHIDSFLEKNKPGVNGVERQTKSDSVAYLQNYFSIMEKKNGRSSINYNLPQADTYYPNSRPVEQFDTNGFVHPKNNAIIPYSEEDLKVSKPYLLLLRKAKILEDYKIPDPIYLDPTSRYLSILSGGLSSPISANQKAVYRPFSLWFHPCRKGIIAKQSQGVFAKLKKKCYKKSSSIIPYQNSPLRFRLDLPFQSVSNFPLVKPNSLKSPFEKKRPNKQSWEKQFLGTAFPGWNKNAYPFLFPSYASMILYPKQFYHDRIVYNKKLPLRYINLNLSIVPPFKTSKVHFTREHYFKSGWGIKRVPVRIPAYWKIQGRNSGCNFSFSIRKTLLDTPHLNYSLNGYTPWDIQKGSFYPGMGTSFLNYPYPVYLDNKPSKNLKETAFNDDKSKDNFADNRRKKVNTFFPSLQSGINYVPSINTLNSNQNGHSFTQNGHGFAMNELYKTERSSHSDVAPPKKKKVLQHKTVSQKVPASQREGTRLSKKSKSALSLHPNRNLRKLRLHYLRNFRRLRFIEYLKATYIKPEWMILSLLPVLPPDLRPVIANPRGYITGDINTHYQNVIYRNNNIEKLLDTFWIPRKFYRKADNAKLKMFYGLRVFMYLSENEKLHPLQGSCFSKQRIFSGKRDFPNTMGSRLYWPTFSLSLKTREEQQRSVNNTIPCISFIMKDYPIQKTSELNKKNYSTSLLKNLNNFSLDSLIPESKILNPQYNSSSYNAGKRYTFIRSGYAWKDMNFTSSEFRERMVYFIYNKISPQNLYISRNIQIRENPLFISRNIISRNIQRFQHRCKTSAKNHEFLPTESRSVDVLQQNKTSRNSRLRWDGVKNYVKQREKKFFYNPRNSLQTSTKISFIPLPSIDAKIIRTQVLHDSKPLQEMQYSLQKAVDALIDNSQKLQSNVLLRKGRPLKSLSDNLKGKEGRFRQHLLGKRVDYSGRSVIVVGPDLKLYECGIPLIMALRLFQPFLILYLIYRFKIASLLATQLIQRKHPMVINLLKKFIETWPILLNRAPTLHRMNIQAFKIRLVQGKAILLHPLVCSSYNADFDGDQMGVHIPITQQSRAESWKLLWSINNSIAIASRQPLFLPSQDMVIGNYYLTQDPLLSIQQKASPHHEFYSPSLPRRGNKSLPLLGGKGKYHHYQESGEPKFATENSLSYFPGKEKPLLVNKINHFFLSIEDAYQYYFNTVYHFHVNTPVWFRSQMVFETSEREKPIEISIDKSGISIYITKYYEKQFKRNRIVASPQHKSSLELVPIKNDPHLKSSLNSGITSTFQSMAFFPQTSEVPEKNHVVREIVKRQTSINVFDRARFILHGNTTQKKSGRSPAFIPQALFNRNLNPICLNQIIRSTFGRIEFYYEAFQVNTETD